LGNKLTAEEVAAWSDPRKVADMTYDEVVNTFHTYSPRVRFLKTLPVGASLLDLGAGDGSLITLRSWPAPARPDLKLYAWAGEKGESFEKFEGWEVGYWPQDPPRFEGVEFGAMFATHFIEHIDDWPLLLRMASDRLQVGGRFFIEWPHSNSVDSPTAESLRAVDVHVTTGCYHDDPTHKRLPPTMDAVMAVLQACGLTIMENGIARVPMVDKNLAILSRRANDVVGMTLAYWSMSGWSQYLVAERL